MQRYCKPPPHLTTENHMKIQLLHPLLLFLQVCEAISVLNIGTG